MPEQYAAAQEEMRQNLGVDETAPWYEQAEALPGAADVATQFIPTAVREATPTAIGSGLRLIGNIAGDPTTYIGGILVKAGTKIAAGSKAGLAALRAAEVGNAVTKAKAAEAVGLGQISAREAAQAIDQARRAGLTEVTRALMAESPVRGRAFMAARAIKEAEPYALGTAAAVAYGPQVVRAGLESGKETFWAALPESIGGEGDAGKALDSGGNFLLMAGLGYLMGKGLIDTAKAKSVLTRELADQGVIPDIDKMIRERAAETGVAPDLTPVQMPPRARPAETRQPFGEAPPIEGLPELELADLTAPRRFRGPVGRGLEGLQEEVRAAGPVEGPLPLPLRTVTPEIPSGFRGRVLSDAELVARLQAEAERGRALAVEEARAAAPAPEGAAGFMPPDQFVSGRRFEPPPFVGQTVLPGMREPRPLPPPAAAPRPRRTGAQLPLDLGEGETIRKPPTAKERREAEEAAVQAKVAKVYEDPTAQVLIDDRAHEIMRQELEDLVRARGSSAIKRQEIAEKRRLLKQGNDKDPLYVAWFAEAQKKAADELTKRMRRMVLGGHDPADLLKKKRAQMEAAAERDAIVEADQPGAVVDTSPAPWDTAAPVGEVAPAPVPPVVVEPPAGRPPAAPRRPRAASKKPPAPPEPPTPAPEAPAAPRVMTKEEQAARAVEGRARTNAPPEGTQYRDTTSGAIHTVVYDNSNNGWALESAVGVREATGKTLEADVRDGLLERVEKPPAEPSFARAPDPEVQQAVVRVSTAEGTERVPYGLFGRFGVKAHDEFQARLREEGWTETSPGSFEKEGRWVDVKEGGPNFVGGKIVWYGKNAPREGSPVAPTAVASKPTEVPARAEPAPAAVAPEPTPVVAKPIPKPSRVTPEVAAERLARTPERWVESVLSVDNEKRAHVRARFEKEPALRGELAQRIGTYLDQARKEAQEKGEEFTEVKARAAAFKARKDFVSERGLDVQEARFPEPAAEADIPSPEGTESQIGLMRQGEGPSREEVTGALFDAEGRRIQVGGEKRGSKVRPGRTAYEARQAAAAEGRSMSPDSLQWHEVLRPNIEDVGATLKKYVEDGAYIDETTKQKLNEKNAAMFVEFQKLYDQFRVNKYPGGRHEFATPFEARALALRTLSGGDKIDPYLRNTVGKIEKLLAKRELEVAARERGVEPPAQPQKAAPPVSVETLRERKASVDHDLSHAQAAFMRGEEGKAGVLEILQRYARFVDDRKGLGHAPNLKGLGDRELQNFAKAILGPDAVKARASADWILDKLAKHFGTTVEDLRSAARKAEPPKPVATTRAAEAVPGDLPAGWKMTREAGTFVSPNGTKITTLHDKDGITVRVYESKGVDELAADAEELMKRGVIFKIVKGKAEPGKIRGWLPAMSRLLERNSDTLHALEDENGVGRSKSASAGMETSNLLDVAGRDWTKDFSERDLAALGVGTDGRSQSGAVLDAHMSDPKKAWGVVESISKALGLDTNAADPVSPVGRGTFHRTFVIEGKDKHGQQFVVRIGKSPYLELPRPEQRALVNRAVKIGEFKAANGERFTYSVHPYAWSPGFSIQLENLPGREKIIAAFRGHYDSQTLPSKAYEQQVLQRLQGKLPDGIGLADYLEDAAKLNQEIERTGLIDTDIFESQRLWRAGQTGYVKLAPGEAPSGIMRVAPDGSRYRLTVLDLGAVRAMEPRGQLSQVPWLNMVALKWTDESLPRTVRDEIERQFDRHEQDALDIGDGLAVVRHHGDDGGLGWGYAALVARYGKEPAKGMKKLVEELVDLIKPKTKVEFRGLTTSPYLSGLYREGVKSGNARIYTNIVEAVHASKSYDDALDLTTKTLIHEVAHLGSIKHEGKFTDLQGYIDNLANSEDWQAHAKQVLKDSGFTEELYGRIKEDLVDQFHAAREAIIGRRGTEAEGATVEGVPGWDASGSAEAKSNLAGGGAKAPPGGDGAGLRPGRNVPGGGVEPAGRVRSAAAAGERAAEGLAEGIETGSLARKGTDEAESLIAGLESRGPGGGDPTEEAVKAIKHMVSAKLLPVTEHESYAMNVARKIVDNMSDDDVQKLMKSAPDPRGRKDVIAGGINLLYDVPGATDRWKAVMVTYANLMDGAGLTARSTPRPWERVEPEVRELLDIHTPEEYMKTFKHTGGGMTDTAHMTLITARDMINSEASRLESAFKKAIEEGDEAGAEKLFKELEAAKNNAAAAITIAQNAATGVGRALAVYRHERLRLEPLDMLHVRVKSQINELLQSRVKDAGERARKATELEQKFFEVLSDRGRWDEFRRALRLAMGRTGMRGAFDKVLEFYKAGLLGWPSEVANLTSNSLFRASRFTEDTIAALVDAGLYKVGAKKDRSFYLGEAAVGARALRRALMEGLKPLLESELKLFQLQGGDMTKILEQGSLAQDLMMASGAIGGKMGNFVRFHFDSMQNFDTFAKHLARTDSLYRDVYRGLMKEGSETVKWLQARKRTGESLVDATERIVGEIRENQNKLQQGLPHDGTLLFHSLGMLKRADEVAKKDTFQADLGETGRGAQAFLTNHPWMQFLVPFFRTPTNILKETWDRTPAGFVKLAMKWDKLTPAERIQSLSKATLGTSIMGTMAMLAANGEITGGGPLSFEERDAMMATGWQPYSVRIGDQWISYQRLEPLSSLVGMAADAMEAYQKGEMESGSATMQKLADSVAENLTNKTFLSGLSALTGAISDPKRELGSFVKQMQQSVVPNSLGFVPFGHLARGLDPVYRQADPMTWDAFTSKIPFMTQTLDPQYGPTGEERRRVGSAFERTFSPYQRRKIEEGPKARGAEELVRAGAVPKAPLRYWTSPQGFRVPLKPEERQALAKALQEATILIGQRIVKDPGYQKLPKDETDPEYRYGQKTKQDVLDGIVRKYRARALDRIKPALKQRSRQMYREREL